MVLQPAVRTATDIAADTGGLLHHLFTLTFNGGFFSVALSLKFPLAAVSCPLALWSPDFPLLKKFKQQLTLIPKFFLFFSTYYFHLFFKTLFIFYHKYSYYQSKNYKKYNSHYYKKFIFFFLYYFFFYNNRIFYFYLC